MTSKWVAQQEQRGKLPEAHPGKQFLYMLLKVNFVQSKTSSSTARDPGSPFQVAAPSIAKGSRRGWGDMVVA